MNPAIFALLAAPQGGRNAGLVLLIQFGAIIAIFWFLLIRPQRQLQKKHQQMLVNLKRGDEVVTDGGVIGEVLHLKDDRVTIRTAENTRLVVLRQKIARVLTETAGAVEKG